MKTHPRNKFEKTLIASIFMLVAVCLACKSLVCVVGLYDEVSILASYEGEANDVEKGLEFDQLEDVDQITNDLKAEGQQVDISHFEGISKGAQLAIRPENPYMELEAPPPEVEV